MLKYSLIACVSENWGIGKNNTIPWIVKEDMLFFKNITTYTSDSSKKNAVIMGRKTYESIGKILPNRYNFVLTKKISDDSDEEEYDLNKINYINTSKLTSLYFYKDKIETVYFIGGEDVYTFALNNFNMEELYINIVHEKYDCDKYFPVDLLRKNDYVITESIKCKTNEKLTFNRLKQMKEEENEYQYLSILEEILNTGNERKTRNAITYSIFDTKLTFDVSEYYPLITTKKMFMKGVVEELLFFLRGDTNSKHLEEKGVNIWKGNTTKEFIEKCGLPYEEGDMGNCYGFQWRHYGAEYKDCHTDYTGKGYDQLKNIINLIENDPSSRRIMMTTFDPSKVHKGVLPPCHSLILQFYIHNKRISCKMYQRSVDSFLGEPFNISSTSLLLYIIGHITGLKPYKVTIDLGDTHIYSDHIEQVREQLTRIPYKFPKLKIKKDIDLEMKTDDKLKFIENLQYEDFELIDYISHLPIKAKMIA
jgi:dihydrofolate reductase / thymidylate synthase